MTALTAFGFASVTAMMLAYAFERRNRAFVLVFALACFAASAYGWLAGTWPFGVVEAVWGCVAVFRWLSAAPQSPR
ncbi:MAG TPA: hypothetical protein VMF61_02670 [Candidatus Acidoferrales bacterium]|nr:hypothetical protein [Candidatus Acidoferrales bacterium]